VLHAVAVDVQALKNGAFLPLDTQKTLSDNGLPDESDELRQLGLDEKEFAPVLQLYFKDDLTEA
jgi:hypothetical protein